ncbi:MAG: nitric oxide reductase F protein [Paracoccaceae bacterium]
MIAATRAWFWLLSLSAASTALAASLTTGMIVDVAPALVGAMILILAWVKARLILNAYLRLSDAPAFRRGFGMTLALYACLLLALYLAGTTRP